jgi:hypothetical protein
MMAGLLCKPWILPSIVQDALPENPKGQILEFISLPTEHERKAYLTLSDRFRFIKAVFSEKCIADFERRYPDQSIPSLKGAIIILNVYNLTTTPHSTEFMFIVEKITHIGCEGAYTFGEPTPLCVDELIKLKLHQNKMMDDNNNDSFQNTDPSALMAMADALSQLSQDQKMSSDKYAPTNCNCHQHDELTDQQCIITESQEAQLAQVWASDNQSDMLSPLAPSTQFIQIPSQLSSQSSVEERIDMASLDDFYENQDDLELEINAEPDSKENTDIYHNSSSYSTSEQNSSYSTQEPETNESEYISNVSSYPQTHTRTPMHNSDSHDRDNSQQVSPMGLPYSTQNNQSSAERAPGQGDFILSEPITQAPHSIEYSSSYTQESDTQFHQQQYCTQALSLAEPPNSQCSLSPATPSRSSESSQQPPSKLHATSPQISQQCLLDPQHALHHPIITQAPKSPSPSPSPSISHTPNSTARAKKSKHSHDCGVVAGTIWEYYGGLAQTSPIDVDFSSWVPSSLRIPGVQLTQHKRQCGT